MSEPSMPAARNVPLGYLRAFVTLLVVLHHSLLAYISQQPPRGSFEAPFVWAAFPVVDHVNFMGFDLIVGFNDIFFMSLMFFISGLFLPQSLARKGAFKFAGARLVRLGVPFAVAAAILSPLAYYPAYLQLGGTPGFANYWHAWISLAAWPSGPAWFLWVLFAFDAIAAAIYLIAPGLFAFLGRRCAVAERRPVRFFFVLVAISACAYLGMTELYGPYRWLYYGPFFVQAARILHYAVYFLAGATVGAFGLDKGLLAAKGMLARRWWLWALLAPLMFVLLVIVVLSAGAAKGPALAFVQVAGGIGFALSCAASSFACIGFFLRFFRRNFVVFDSLARNAYGMYMFHYAIVSWTQYALLPAGYSAVEKGAIVFATAVIGSWLTTFLVRRIPVIDRIL